VEVKVMVKKFMKFAVPCIMLTMLTWGCAQDKTAGTDPATKPAAVQQTANVYKGKIVGKSKKAKTISIEVGKGDKAQTMMVLFDGSTRGLEHAAKGKAAIITWKMRGSDKVATVIKPKLAKLPEGVAEIKAKEVKKLLDRETGFVLVDCRPAKQYSQAHLPAAVSIPVSQFSAKGPELLPVDKDKLLVFYCGGPT
jgi:hypothetical protein